MILTSLRDDLAVYDVVADVRSRRHGRLTRGGAGPDADVLERPKLASFHKFCENHRAGPVARHLTSVYRVGVKDEASSAFTGHRYDVVVLADVLVGEARESCLVVSKKVRPVRCFCDSGRPPISVDVVQEQESFQSSPAAVVVPIPRNILRCV